MDCPKCGSNDVYANYIYQLTTSTTDSGVLKCAKCSYIFRIIYAPYKEQNEKCNE